MSRLDGDLNVTGTLTAEAIVLPANSLTANTQVQAGADIARSKMAQSSNDIFPIPVHACRVWDSWQQLPAAAANDDMGCIAGTWGTDVPHLESSDSGETSVTQYWGFEFTLPDNYDEAQSITVRIPAKMKVVSDTTATLDVECYLSDSNALKSGSDLITTAAQSIKFATWDDYDYAVTSTSRAPGDKLFLRCVVAIVDSGTAAADVTAVIGDIEMLIDTRG